MKSTVDTELFEKLRIKYDKEITDLIHNLPMETLDYIKSVASRAEVFFKQSSFEVKLVVDTNILYSEVRSLMINGTSFFLKIADNPLLKIYAPTQLKEELYDKIRTKFKKDPATKDLDVEQCLKQADLLLTKVTLHDEISSEAINKAQQYLQQRDLKDTNFLALSFSLNSHGLLTRDKDYSVQSEVKLWSLRDTGAVITDIGKASFSFIVTNLSVKAIWEVLYALIITLWKIFTEMIFSIIALLSSLVAGSISAIRNMPPALQLISGAILISVLLVEDLRNNFSEFLSVIWNEVRKIIATAIDLFKSLWLVLEDIYEALKPLFSVSLELLGYFSLLSANLVHQLEDLDKSRPGNPPFEI